LLFLKKLFFAGSLLCLAAGVAFAGSTQVDVTYLLHNTGSAGTSAFGLPDPNWTLITPGDPVQPPAYRATAYPTFNTAPAYVTNLSSGQFPAQYWLGETGSDTSTWISPCPSYPGLGSDAESASFDFQTTFDLTGYSPDSAALSFKFVTDNSLTEVLINGVPVAFAPGTGLMAWSGSSAISGSGLLTGGLFTGGLNTLDFIVQNDAGLTGNPTGLRVEFAGQASATPEPGSLAMLGSGILLFGGLLRRKFAR